MSLPLSPQKLKATLPHTWPLFFARYGNFTAVQTRTIQPILAGKDLLLTAATASGKTEAVIAPLLERLWHQLQAQKRITILYICPTRALARDLYERLQNRLTDTGISVAIKTGDTAPISAKKPPHVLLTTPESADSLLTRAARQFVNLEAIILDEIHLFDRTPRGDHIRCLLKRFARIRAFAQPNRPPCQHIALSATVPDPHGIKTRYLTPSAEIVSVAGQRKITADIIPLTEPVDLSNELAQRQQFKTLIFCNARYQVEEVAAFLRRNLTYHADIFVHYGTLDAALRQDVEQRFATARVAICVATSTLELGIDIGDIDDVVLYGAPFDLTSFLQRIGRGGRRTQQTTVLCVAQSPLEWLRFEAFLALTQTSQTQTAEIESESISYFFRPSVLIQQIFSLLKQFPNGSIRLDDLQRIAPSAITRETLANLFDYLTAEQYLLPGRLGEWLPGPEAADWFDHHEIHSNIGTDVRLKTAIDTYTGRALAQTDKIYEKGTTVLFAGKGMEVVWIEKYRFGLAPGRRQDVTETLRFHYVQPSVPFAVTQQVGKLLGLQPNQLGWINTPADEDGVIHGGYLFHCWGTIWGKLLARVLSQHYFMANPINEYCLSVAPHIGQLPPYNQDKTVWVARQLAAEIADTLQMGRFHTILPPRLAINAVVDQLALPAFAHQYQHAHLIPIASPQQDRFLSLIS